MNRHRVAQLLAREPVRARLYALLVLLVPALVTTGDTAALVLGVLAVLLGVPAVETARARVSPVDVLHNRDDPFTE